MRPEDMTPDVIRDEREARQALAAVTRDARRELKELDRVLASQIARRQYRRPRTRLGRSIRKLLGQWWVWTTYVGLVIGTAIYFLFAPPAAADEMVWTFTAPAADYVNEHGVEICTTLDHATSPHHVSELIHKLQFLGGLTEQQAGEALYLSALTICPIHMALLDAYAERSLVLA